MQQGGLAFVLLFGRGKISELMGYVARGIKSFRKGLADSDDEAAIRAREAITTKSPARDAAESVQSMGSTTDRRRSPTVGRLTTSSFVRLHKGCQFVVETRVQDCYCMLLV
jgi:Sec-independent protein translocase protein TatA